MRALGDRTKPYEVRFSLGAGRRAHALAPDVRDRIRAKLTQLAELSALSQGYTLALPKRAVLNAEVEGFSIRYEIDEVARTLTAIDLLERKGGSR